MLKETLKALNIALNKVLSNTSNKVYKRIFDKDYLKVMGQIIAGTFIVAICTNIFLVPTKL